MRKLKTIALWTICSALALFFVACGTASFVHPAVPRLYAGWGYPDWVRTVAALLAVGGGLMLLWPRAAWRGAALLGLLAAGVGFTLLLNGEPAYAVFPAGLVGLVAVAGYARHPRATAMSRLRAAVEWVAEREIAEQRQRSAAGRNRLQGLPGYGTAKARTGRRA